MRILATGTFTLFTMSYISFIFFIPAFNLLRVLLTSHLMLPIYLDDVQRMSHEIHGFVIVFFGLSLGVFICLCFTFKFVIARVEIHVPNMLFFFLLITGFSKAFICDLNVSFFRRNIGWSQ